MARPSRATLMELPEKSSLHISHKDILACYQDTIDSEGRFARFKEYEGKKAMLVIFKE